MQTVLRLIKDPAPRPVYDPGRSLFTTMSRETVQEDRLGSSMVHQLLVHLIRCKLLLALLGLSLLAHAGPHVRVDGLRAGHSFVRVLSERRGEAELRGELYDLGTRGMSFGM